MNSKTPIKVFISYAHDNEEWVDETNERSLLRYWRRAFRNYDILFWYDREKDTGIAGGDLWDKRIKEEINKADIAVLLVTQDFVIAPYA